MAKRQPGSSNIFNISKPMAYRCQIAQYHRRLSRLYLAVYQGRRDEPAFHLLFTDVAYLDAPMSWLGADFDIAEQPDCIALMREAGLVGAAIERFPEAYAAITDHARLYLARTPHRRARIIAGSAAILTSIPDDLG
ncbi:MAG: hypothetical protein OXE95_10455 [Chloroflexi bacterium]|nr:hypothetical protein [Chloroflexota bacterium]MCY4247980.1 hypothetical protein [Chloroflexota bacterium]